MASGQMAPLEGRAPLADAPKYLPPPSCPSPRSLRYRCRMAPAAASVCRTTADCALHGYGARRADVNCCPTPCHYSLCIAKHRNNSYVIG